MTLHFLFKGSSPCCGRAQAGAWRCGEGASSLLVFLVNLSIKQSVSHSHSHKIISYVALSWVSTWESLWERCLVCWSDAACELRAPVGARWELWGLSASCQGQTGCGKCGELPWQGLPCNPVPLLLQRGDAAAPSSCNPDFQVLIPHPCWLWITT